MKTRNERKQRRRERIIDILLLLGIVACAVCAIRVSRKTQETNEAVRNAQVSLSAARATQEQLLIISDMTKEVIPDPDEDEKIQAALVAQGYFRDDIPLGYELQDVLQSACEEHGVRYALALALIETESGFVLDADNGVCYGLMQLNRNYFPADLTPAANIREGVRYLGELLVKYDGDEAKALVAYNQGSYNGTVTNYAKIVLSRAESWEVILEG